MDKMCIEMLFYIYLFFFLSLLFSLVISIYIYMLVFCASLRINKAPRAVCKSLRTLIFERMPHKTFESFRVSSCSCDKIKKCVETLQFKMDIFNLMKQTETLSLLEFYLADKLKRDKEIHLPKGGGGRGCKLLH